MVQTTLTGLLPVSRKKVGKQRKEPIPKLDFQSCIQPVNYVLKPLTGIYKPFRYGCSILCNHPGDTELKDAIQRTKVKKKQDRDEEKELAERLGQCLEEMLERYSTEMPPHAIFTPRRTFESSTASSSFETSRDRKCITPQPHPKQFIVLDLRRTLSQDTLNTNIGGRIQSSIMSPTESSLCGTTRPSTSTMHLPKVPPSHHKTGFEEQIELRRDRRIGEDEDEEEVPRRRGKLRRKKKKITGRDLAEGGREVMGILEPGETQVSTYVEGGGASSCESPEPGVVSPHHRPPATEHQLESNIFDQATLKHLRRYAPSEGAECEFRKVWRRVLTEALKVSEITPEEEMKHVREQIDIQPCQPEDWLALPRTFSMDAARFELPLDRCMLDCMTALEYLRDYVSVKNNRKLLYNHVFNKYVNEEERPGHFIDGSILLKALGEVMGRPLTEDEEAALHKNIDWSETDLIDLRTWSGICAFAERLLGKQFTAQPDQDMGSRPTIEVLDFNLLPKWLNTTSPNQHLRTLLINVASS